MTDSGQTLERGQADRRPVLVSACLAGRRCTYKATANPLAAEWRAWLERLIEEDRAVLVCPEVEGGLGTPRPPAEILGGDGHDVLDGRARVLAADGTDVTESYLRGAERAVERARAVDAGAAVLKARSPSCGRGVIYDGSFSHTLAPGDGVTAAALQRAGIAVMSDEELESEGPAPSLSWGI